MRLVGRWRVQPGYIGDRCPGTWVTRPPPFGLLQEGPMPWQEESTMQLRRQFIQDVQSGATPITELCTAYGISRKTGYKWLTRYEAGGLPALADQSRRPQSSPSPPRRAGARPARGAASSPHLGTAQVAPRAAPTAADGALARAQHPRPASPPRRTRGHAAPGAPSGTSRATPGPDGCAQRDLDRGLQRQVQARRWSVLLSAHRRGWVQPDAAALSGADQYAIR